jgi:hypothetical protein
MMAWRLPGALALCAVALRRWWPSAREAGSAAGPGVLGLLGFCGAGAFLVGDAPGRGFGFLAAVGGITVLVAAVALADLVLRRRWDAPGASRCLLLSAGVAAGLAALVVGLQRVHAWEPTPARARLTRAVEPGSRIYVWGSLFDLEIYGLARGVPAVPQLATFMLERVGLPPLGGGWHALPEVAKLDSLDRALATQQPRYVVDTGDLSYMGFTGDVQAPPLTEFPRFGPVLRARYRLIESLPQGKLYEHLAPEGPGPR